MRRLSLPIATTIAFTQIASAADMAVKAPLPPPPAFSWTGWYVGPKRGLRLGLQLGQLHCCSDGRPGAGNRDGPCLVWHLQSRS